MIFKTIQRPCILQFLFHFRTNFFKGLTDALGACICHRINRNNNAQYNIINSVLPVVFQIHTCFIFLRKVSSITLGVFIGKKSSSCFLICCKRENSSSQIISDVRSGLETILPRHMGWQTSIIGSNCLITL